MKLPNLQQRYKERLKAALESSIELIISHKVKRVLDHSLRLLIVLQLSKRSVQSLTLQMYLSILFPMVLFPRVGASIRMAVNLPITRMVMMAGVLVESNQALLLPTLQIPLLLRRKHQLKIQLLTIEPLLRMVHLPSMKAALLSGLRATISLMEREVSAVLIARKNALKLSWSSAQSMISLMSP